MTADTITAIKKALEDMSALIAIVAKDTGALVMSDPDEDSVGSTLEGDLEMTFGHVRRAHQAISTLESLQRENQRLRQFLFPYADNTEISGISWDGKYLIGDKASIKAFHEMQNRGLQIDVYKRAYDEKEASLKAEAEYLRGVANDIQKGYIEEKERAEEAVTAANALQVRADTAEAKVARLSTSTNPNWHDAAQKALASTGGERHAE